MKCPFCGGDLTEEIFHNSRTFVCCSNPKCPIQDWGGVSKSFVEQFITLKTQVEIAKERLEEIKECACQGGEDAVKLWVKVKAAAGLQEISCGKRFVDLL